jgi:hypothetical protein
MSVGKPFQIVLRDLGGGLNEEAPTGLQDREWSALSNFRSFGTKLLRRGGLAAITDTPYANGLTSLFAFKTALGAWLLLVGLRDGIGKVSGLSVVPLASADTYASLDDPWIMRQYKDEVFACRPKTGTLKKVSADFVQNAGLPAPLTAATISQGGAGSKEAGNRQLVYTYYVKESAAESNPSPVSNTLNLAASKKLIANGVTASLNPQVNARRLYETAPNQEGEYYFVKQQDDNIQVDGIENDVAQDDLGRSVSFENGLPPDGIAAIEIANERLFAAVGSVVWFSQVGMMQAFSEYDFIPIMEDDGHTIVDLVAWGDVLAVPKTGGIYVLRNAGTRSLERGVISEKHGVRGLSTQVAEGSLLWYSGENVYRSEGGVPSAISTLRVRKTLDRIPELYKHVVRSAVLPKQSLYLLAVPLDGATTPSHIVAYNYKTDVWDVVTPSQAPLFFGRFFETTFNEALYGAFADGRIYEMESGLTDAGTAILAVARSKAFDYALGPGQKGIRTIGLNTPATAASIKIRVYNDEKSTYVKERTMSLSRDGWKRLNVSTLGTLAGTHQIELEYSGSPALEIHEVEIEGLMFPARKPKAQ